MYLYHVAVERDGHLEGVPACELGRKAEGGRFWLTTDSLRNSEIVQGTGPGRLEDFCDRKRVKQ